MKTDKKQRFLAGKWWISLFLLLFGVFSFGGVFAKETEGKACKDRNRVGCVWDTSCFWDKNAEEGSECIPKGDNDEAKYNWKESDCGNDKNFDDSVKDDVEYFYYDKDNEKKSELISIEDACNRKVNGATLAEDKTISHICDYSEHLSNKGKKKCRKYNDWKAKIKAGGCIDSAETFWQASLKDREAREERDRRLNKCNHVSYVYESYDGPVFDGPGLSGGAQMAQIELSNSISKQRDIKKLLISWSRFAIQIAIVLAVIAIIWAGIRFITDMGDGAGVEAGKKIIMWTVVGLVLIMGSYAIVNTVIKARFGSDLASNITINHFIT